MEKPKITTYCGLDCDSCEFKEKNNCKGCVASGGNPFHGECSVAKVFLVDVNCEEYPCEKLKAFATISPDGICPNVKCCNEKNFDGCWECEELLSCGKGFYKPDNDGARACKAQALFIKNHGKEEFLKEREKLRQINPEMKKIQEALDGSVEDGLKKLEELM